ncbi:hypothetical protein CHELA1G11_12846 [Hyphomicrobiales bacterium]|nr:hypothetical protein CHELA1G11_12846 [Hyphomicrobiales bacterium]
MDSRLRNPKASGKDAAGKQCFDAGCNSFPRHYMLLVYMTFHTSPPGTTPFLTSIKSVT